MSQPANDEFSQHLSDDEASNHEDASDTGAAPKQQQQVIPQTTAISNIKLPILKKEEYDIWAMEMEHYLEYIDNDVWKVIQNGNSKKRISTGKDGVIRILPPVTAAEIQVVEKERKAKNILLMAIPKEHMRRFHGIDDAKEIWEAIKLEGLEKGYDRFQQLLSQLEAHGAEVSTEDANHKVFEQAIQIDDLDIEEMDINWQIAMISIRMKKFYKKTRRRVRVDGKATLLRFGKKKRDSFYQHQEAGKQGENHIGLLTNGLMVLAIGENSMKIEETNSCTHGYSSSSEPKLRPQSTPLQIMCEALQPLELRQSSQTRRSLHSSLFLDFKRDHSLCKQCSLKGTKNKTKERLTVDYLLYEDGLGKTSFMALLGIICLNQGGKHSSKLRKNLIKEFGYRNAMDVKDVPDSPREENISMKDDDESSTWESPSRNEAIKAAITLEQFLVGYEENNTRRSIGTSTEHSVDPEFEISRVPQEVSRQPVPTRTSNSFGPKRSQDHPLKNMVDRGIFDSGCSGHMTGNKDQLEDFEEFNGGSVTFEMHKVLFTETKCLVVSSDFKMPDENQILLKVPRHHNMYSFDMKTPSLSKDYACLIAKATCG
ncbi:hypothetical protein Tco_0846424 [Tanacetum coccineum]